MNLETEIKKLVRAVETDVEAKLRARVHDALGGNTRRVAASKVSRGVRHCRLCEKRGHDARNCDEKGKKAA